MCAILPTSGQLLASKTHKARHWTWVPTRDLTKPALGTLTIVQGRREAVSYSIDVESIGRDCHQVLFVKLDDAGDVYGVTCDSTGKPVACTCSGHGRFGHCKHRDATVELLADDVLPPLGRPTAPASPPVHGIADLECF